MDLSTLASLFSIGDSTKKAIAESDPYAQGVGISNTLLGQVVKANDYPMRDRIMASVLTGLGGGIFGGLSEDYQTRAKNAYESTLLDTIAGKDPEKPDVLPSSVFSSAQDQAKLFGATMGLSSLQSKMEAAKAQDLESTKAANQIKQDVVKGLLSKDPKENARAFELADALGLTKELGLGALKPTPIATPAETAKTEAEKPKSIFGEGPTLQEKLEASVQRFLDKEVSPSAAGDLATKAQAASLIQNKIAATKVESIRDQVTKLDDIIGTGSRGIAGAGKTGGSFAGWRDTASRIAAFAGDDEQQAKQTAQTELDSVKPLIVGANKFPGALSDSDLKLLVGGGISSDKTPEQNTALLNNMQLVRGRMNDYANFMDMYLAERGDLQGADLLWGKYRDANPLTTKDENGTPTLNTKITPWDQFDFMGAIGKKPGAPLEVKIEATPTTLAPTTQPTTPKQYTASELLAQGYKKTAQGWVK